MLSGTIEKAGEKVRAFIIIEVAWWQEPSPPGYLSTCVQAVQAGAYIAGMKFRQVWDAVAPPVGHLSIVTRRTS
jgi:hypothetical protein